MTDDNMTTNANMLMGLIAENLAKDGIISNPEVITENYYVIMVKPNLFLSAFYKMKGFIFDDDDEIKLQFAIMPLNSNIRKLQLVKSSNEVSE
jgi:hypothetical protein